MHSACQVAILDAAAGLQVKCQAHGTSTRAVLAELWGLGSKRAGVATLYRGLGTKAAVAGLVGAFYLSSFHLFRCWLLTLTLVRRMVACDWCQPAECLPAHFPSTLSK